MKIGNSVIQFNLKCTRTPSGEPCTMENVPYWRVYSQPGDWKQDADGRQWRSYKAMTYELLMMYLQKCPLHHVWAAYPRFSQDERASFEHHYDKVYHEFHIINKWTGEIVYIADANTAETKYLSPDYKNAYDFRKKFFCKDFEGQWQRNWYANMLMCD